MENHKSINNNKYVPISAFVELEKLPTKDSITNFTKGKEKTKEIIEYLNWNKSQDELISFCRATYETYVPQKFDFLIDLLHNSGGIEINATIIHAIWNGMIPLNIIDLGYKTIIIIKFKNGIPKCLDSLNELSNADFKTRFALCSKSNKAEIIKELKTLANNG